MKKSLYLLIILSTALFSCVKPDNIRVTSFGGVSIGNITKNGVDGNIVISAENDGRPVTIKNMEITLFLQQSLTPFLTVESSEPVTIAKGTNNGINIPLNMKIKGGLLGSLVLKSIFEKNIANVTVTVKGEIKSGAIPVKINIEKMPISQIMHKLGIDDARTKNLF